MREFADVTGRPLSDWLESPPSLEDWLVDRFGARDERLLTDPDLTEKLRDDEQKVRKQWQLDRRELKALDETFEQTVETARTADGVERDELARKAALMKKKYQVRQRRSLVVGERLAAVSVVRTLRELDDDVPDPDATERPVRTALRDAGLPSVYHDDYLRSVQKAVDFPAPDPLAWVPLPSTELGPVFDDSLDPDVTDDVADETPFPSDLSEDVGDLSDFDVEP
jgi:hypothetical protein